MGEIKSRQCIHCKDEMYCKIQEEGCNGYVPDCPDYELKTDSFYKTPNYQELKSKLTSEEAILLVQVVGEAIQYGISFLAKKQREDNPKEREDENSY